MAFTAKDVVDLREKTGAGMLDCKKALTECNGNMDKLSTIYVKKVLQLLLSVNLELLLKVLYSLIFI